MFDRLRKCIGPFLAPFHPEESVANVFGVGWSAQAHVAAFDPAITGETPGLNASFFSRVERPAFEMLLEIGILDVRKKEWVFCQEVLFAFNGIVPVKLTNKADSFLVCLQRGPPV